MKRIFAATLSGALALIISGCGDGAAPVAPPDDPAHINETNFASRVENALAHIKLGEVAKADADVSEALTVYPDSAEAKLVDGQVAYLKRDYKRALSDFAAVAKESSLSPALRSDAFVGRGVVEMAQENHDLARISFLRAMRLNRRNAAAWYHLGMLFRDVYHLDAAALEQFEMAARFSDPREERTKKLSAKVIPGLRGKLQKAAASIPGVAKRDPAMAAKLLAEGEALQAKKSIRAAIKKYGAAFAADPLCDTAAVKYAYLVSLNEKTPAGVDKALAAYAAAYDQRPERQSNYLAAGRLAYANGRWSIAVKIMNRAVAHDPENRQALDLLIAALLKSGKTKQAEAWKSYRAEVK